MLETTTGVSIACQILTPTNAPDTVTFATSNTDGAAEDFNILKALVNPALQDKAFMFVLTEGALNTNYEVTQLILEAIEEPYKP